jgi:hypothetical protein
MLLLIYKFLVVLRKVAGTLRVPFAKRRHPSRYGTRSVPTTIKDGQECPSYIVDSISDSFAFRESFLMASSRFSAAL